MIKDMNKIMYILAAAALLLTVGCKKEKVDPTKPSITWTATPASARWK